MKSDKFKKFALINSKIKEVCFSFISNTFLFTFLIYCKVNSEHAIMCNKDRIFKVKFFETCALLS
jgi:hypothetical protein